MNTPPRFFAAPPPSARRRGRISLAFGAALIAAWLLALVAVAVLHLPPVWAKVAVGAAATAWAAHVLTVVLRNRRLDRG